MSHEPKVVIDGVELTSSHAMTLRVAVTHYQSQMSDPTVLGDDDHGRFMTKSYHKGASDILALMFASMEKQDAQKTVAAK